MPISKSAQSDFEYRIYANKTEAKKIISNLACAQLVMKIPGSEFSSVNWMLRSNRARSVLLHNDHEA